MSRLALGAELFDSIELPPLLIGRFEVNRLFREAESLDDFMHQADIRQPGKQPKRPELSFLLEQLCRLNDINILEADQRRFVLDFLTHLKQTSPVMHISFATEAQPQFIKKLISYLRQDISKHLLLDIGLAPGIKAGCLVRTTNKQFDFSLRKRFIQNRPLLLERVRTLG